eukprot:3700485-Prymnesium_polylepis.1
MGFRVPIDGAPLDVLRELLAECVGGPGALHCPAAPEKARGLPARELRRRSGRGLRWCWRVHRAAGLSRQLAALATAARLGGVQDERIWSAGMRPGCA